MAGQVVIISLVLLLVISSAISAPAETEQIEPEKQDIETPEKEDLKASASHWGGWGGHYGGHYGGHWGGHYGYWPHYGGYWGWPSYSYYWPYIGHYGHHGYWW